MNSEELKKHAAFAQRVVKAETVLLLFKKECAALHEYLHEYNLLEEKEQILGEELARYV